MVVHPRRATRTGRWSTHCYITAVNHSRNQRGTAPGHRPPHRPGHLRLIIAAKSDFATWPGRPASGPLPLPGVRGGGGGRLSGGRGHRGAPHRAALRRPQEDGRGPPAWPGGDHPLDGPGTFSGYTHLQCRLETGRTHQIRVHLAPSAILLGDTVYGAKKPYPGLAGQCLHAKRLSFVHPRTGERVTVECPLPEYFRLVLEKLRRL